MIYGHPPDAASVTCNEFLLDCADNLLKNVFLLAEVRKPTDPVEFMKFLAVNISSNIR